MYKFLFELFTSELTLPIEPLHEWIIMTIIGVIAFCVGWNVSDGGEWGSLVHWVVRFIVFVALWFVVGVVLIIAQWIINNWILVLSIVCGVLLLIAIISIIGVIIIFKKVGKKTENDETNEEQ